MSGCKEEAPGCKLPTEADRPELLCWVPMVNSPSPYSTAFLQGRKRDGKHLGGEFLRGVPIAEPPHQIAEDPWILHIV